MDDNPGLKEFLAQFLTIDFWRRHLTSANIRRAVLVVGTILCLRYFGAVFACILGIILIFRNLGERSGGVSAYSVFNRGANYLLGDLRLSRIDQELRNTEVAADDDGRVVEYRPPLELRSRDANKKCPCGSGKKLKKCCGI